MFCGAWVKLDSTFSFSLLSFFLFIHFNPYYSSCVQRSQNVGIFYFIYFIFVQLFKGEILKFKFVVMINTKP